MTHLTPQLLLSAYSQGIFPMADEDGSIYWYDPDPRAILPLDGLHISRSLARTLKRNQFEVRVNSAFTAVMHACAAPDDGREDTWISEEIITAYTNLHNLRFAHSVETWFEGKLVGGLYGVALRGLFAGESMFSRETDASKVALVYLVNRLRERGYLLLDVQFLTGHLQRLGAVELPQAAYKKQLAQAMQVVTWFD
ncbi:MAG: leucyl/phenylalanyl-tRNA--protein transferase [Ardenticatenaceae bacterium]|nr:leucyl/phenylalanyl-tRNA--protein transferase [Ardenticatenaceae bacterium]MCB9443379.1 leucyl/phenylalanyl-tRNA--protein transferase [Ardenticatenaceae bacterium]